MFTSYEPGWTADDGPASRAAERERMWAEQAPPRRSLFDPLQFVLFVWKGRYWILLLGLLGAGLAAAIALATPKEYTASTQLILDPRGLNLVQNEVTPTGFSNDATLALIQSQIAVISSNSVLLRVVDQANLTTDPEFNGTMPGLAERLLPSALLLLLQGEEEEEVVADRRLVTLANLRERVGAARNANSFVIDLSVTSLDAEKAARLANLTADIFVEEQARAQSEIAGRASSDLSSRLTDLRQRVSDAESAVERYKAENNLVGVGGRLIDDEYILRINNQLADVRASITALDVRAQSMRNASVDDVMEGTIPEELSSEALVRARQSYAELQQNHAVLAARLGPRHPQRIASEEALASARSAIAGELSRIVASAQTELARARETERELTAQIEDLRSQQIETSGSFVELRELERDVDASRAVYENYLLRARELAQQESLNTVNVRTISEATAPFHPSGMSRKTVVAVGLFAGLAIGFAIVAALAIIKGFRLAFSQMPVAIAAGPGSGFAGPYVALPGPRPRRRSTSPRHDDVDRDAEPEEPAAEAPPPPSSVTPRNDTQAQSATEAPGEPEAAAVEAPDPSAPEEPAVRPDGAGADDPSEETESPDTDGAADRRARLRARIREIASRSPSASSAIDMQAQQYVEQGATRPRRLTIAEIRRRRQQGEKSRPSPE